METPMLTVLGDVTSGILKICDNKGKQGFVVDGILDTFRKLVINHGDTTKQYQLSSPNVYNYGSFGIVFGLTEFDESKSGEVLSNNPPTHILKVDCSKQDGVILKTAIKVNRVFNEYGEHYNRYKALEYGIITDSTKTFAVYKFLGEELDKLIFDEKRGQTPLDEASVKTIIRNVIRCLLDFNKNYLLHGDVNLLNFVIDTDNNVSLIDFDTMKNLKKLIEGNVESCAIHRKRYFKNILVYEVYPFDGNRPDENEPIQIEDYWGNSIFPSFTTLMGDTKEQTENLKKGDNVIMEKISTVNRLMMPDKIGLFWVIVKILLGAAGIGLTEDDIEEQLTDVENVARLTFLPRNQAYMKFYESLNKETNVIALGNKIFSTAEYITSGGFGAFILELIKLIKLDNNDGNIDSFTKLLQHSFLTDTGQTSQSDDSPSVQLGAPQSVPLGDSPSVPSGAPLSVPSGDSPSARDGGSYNKKRRPSRATRHTKKRNTRKKQNRRNKTKRVKLNRIRK